MQNAVTIDEIQKYIDNYLTILDNNFSLTVKKKIPYDEIYEMICDLNSLFNEFYLKK